MRRTNKLHNGKQLLNLRHLNNYYGKNSNSCYYYSVQSNESKSTNNNNIGKNSNDEKLKGRKLTKLLYSSILKSARAWEQTIVSHENQIDHQFELHRLITQLPLMLQAESKEIVNNNTQNLSIITYNDIQIKPIIVQIRNEIQDEIKAAAEEDSKDKAHQRTINDMFSALKVFNDRTSSLKKTLLFNSSASNENHNVQVQASTEYVAQTDSTILGDIRYTYRYTIQIFNVSFSNLFEFSFFQKSSQILNIF